MAGDKSKKERVRGCLIERLQADGVIRAKGVTVEQHDLLLARMETHLGYLSDADLGRLAAILVCRCGGKAKNEWPGWAVIWNHAVVLDCPPPHQNHIAYTWLHSVEGPRLRNEGLLVVAYQWLLRFPFPPDATAMGMMRSEAAAANAELDRSRAMLAEGRKVRHHIDAVARYDHYFALANEIVKAGEAHRAGREAQ